MPAVSTYEAVDEENVVVVTKRPGRLFVLGQDMSGRDQSEFYEAVCDVREHLWSNFA